jgi:hypothetical protein
MQRNERTEASRSRSGRRGLLMVNGLLLALLAAVTFNPSADAQARVRGSYVMAAGGVNGAVASAVFIVDTVNEEMIALTYEPSQSELIGIGYRSLTADAASLARGGANR